MIPHKWSKDELQFMKKIVPGRTRKEIHKAVNEKFGLTLSLTQVESCMKRNGLKNGLDARFTAGHEPANKGQKMSPEQYAKCKATMFNAGCVPMNTDPIGTEKVLSDGYVWVKINDIPHAKKRENWIQKHRLIWEQEYGPIPEGHRIIFLDGDKGNMDINNLACVTSYEHLRLNAKKMRFADRELTRSAVYVEKVSTLANERKKQEKSKG